MIFANLLLARIILGDWGGVDEVHQGNPGSGAFCLMGVFVVGMLLLLIAVIGKPRPDLTLPTSESYPIKLWHTIEEVSGRTVLRLQWWDIHNPTKGEKHYIVKKSFGTLAITISQVGTTEEAFLIDHNFNLDDCAVYWVECLENKRESNRVAPSMRNT